MYVLEVEPKDVRLDLEVFRFEQGREVGDVLADGVEVDDLVMSSLTLISMLLGWAWRSAHLDLTWESESWRSRGFNLMSSDWSKELVASYLTL